MPTAYIHNMPVAINGDALKKLHLELSAATRKVVKVKKVRTTLTDLLPDGTIEVSKTALFAVDMYPRTKEMKLKMAKAFHRFAEAHHFDSFVAFSERPPDSFFMNGEASV